jgi:hypothetical protein
MYWIFYLVIINAILGILQLEFILKKMDRYTDGNEARDEKFPAWRRRDAQNFTRAKLYPGAMTVLFIRTLIVVIILATLSGVVT